MKKLICAVLSAVLAAGALALFAGCGEREVDEAARAEVLAAFETAEISAYEASVDVNTMQKTTASRFTDEKLQWSDTRSEEATTGTTKITAYEQGGLVFGDSYSNFIGTNGTARYAVVFLRGQAAFTADGKWEELGVKAGDFDELTPARLGLLKPADNVHLAVDGLGQYGNVGFTACSKVYEIRGGYRIKYDVVDALGGIFEQLKGGATYYKEHPDCTLKELFSAADLEGMDVMFPYVAETLEKTPSVPNLFGSPDGFEEIVREAAENPEAFLLRNLFGFPMAGNNTGSIDFTVTVDLDKNYAVTKLGSALHVTSHRESYEWYTSEDYVLTELDTEIEVEMEVDPLASEPELVDLSWLLR